MKLTCIMMVMLTTLSIQPAESPAENWHTVEPWIRETVFQELENVLRKNDWETIDDKTAIKLRAVKKKLYDDLAQHWEQKSEKHQSWIQSTVTDPYKQQQGFHYSTVIIEKEKPIAVAWLRTNHGWGFVDCIKSDVLDESRKHILSPYSTVVGPSGNTLYGIVESREEDVTSNTHTSLYGQRVCFTLYQDGSLKASDMQVIKDPVFCQSGKNNCDVSYVCRRFNNESCWSIVETYADFYTDIKRAEWEHRVIVGSMGSQSVVYQNSMSYKSMSWLPISIANNIVSQYAEKNHHKAQLFLEYQFKKNAQTGHIQSDCYEHRVAYGEAQSLPLTHLSESLRTYILQCPAAGVDECDTHITPAPQRLIHTFIPNDEWPAEAFDLSIQHILSVNSKQNDEEEFSTASERCVKEYTLSKLARLYQAKAVLGCEMTGILNTAIINRTIMSRSATATIYCDVFGRLHYRAYKQMDPTIVDDNLGNGRSEVFEKWARYLIPIGPLPGPGWHDLQKYLCTRRHAALQVSALDFLSFFTLQAQKHAQQTWDNGTIGALWQFDADGMRVHLYDLNAAGNNKRIGTHLIQGRSEGSITDIEYIPNQQPIFYIDGNKVID